jgi:hypothetical protein
VIAKKSKKSKSLQSTSKLRLRLIAYILFLIFLIVGGILYFDFSRVDLIMVGYWIAVLVLIAAIFRKCNQLRYARQLNQVGIPTSGKIIKRGTNEGVDYTDFILTYSYLANQQADAEVPSKIYHSAKEGDQVRVMYLPHQPAISRLDLSSIPERPESPTALRPTPMRDERPPRE